MVGNGMVMRQKNIGMERKINMIIEEIDLEESDYGFIGIGNIYDEIFRGVVIYENSRTEVLTPYELNEAINEAYRFMSNEENVMIIIH